ncbi:hypothetical protein NE237_019098 [Protea cynaroides]|uniref:Uncharacterized protein n=1 Tax=Protea cynaroides TaxID=273540 RepID=A0A9Q0KB86_9MAGN|nr:hypothetical protein NE237_019098 [Protea cynaroides]
MVNFVLALTNRRTWRNTEVVRVTELDLRSLHITEADSKFPNQLSFSPPAPLSLCPKPATQAISLDAFLLIKALIISEKMCIWIMETISALPFYFWQREAASLRQQLQNLQENHRADGMFSVKVTYPLDRKEWFVSRRTIVPSKMMIKVGAKRTAKKDLDPKQWTFLLFLLEEVKPFAGGAKVRDREISGDLEEAASVLEATRDGLVVEEGEKWKGLESGGDGRQNIVNLKLRYIPTISVAGTSIGRCHASIVDNEVNGLKNTLVAVFLGKRPVFAYVSRGKKVAKPTKVKESTGVHSNKSDLHELSHGVGLGHNKESPRRPPVHFDEDARP